MRGTYCVCVKLNADAGECGATPHPSIQQDDTAQAAAW
jgi:hypothetical protein